MGSGFETEAAKVDTVTLRVPSLDSGVKLVAGAGVVMRSGQGFLTSLFDEQAALKCGGPEEATVSYVCEPAVVIEDEASNYRPDPNGLHVEDNHGYPRLRGTATWSGPL